jgi:hypothetical protein
MPERCSVDTRRSLVRQSALNGIDWIEMLGDRRTLLVHFFRDAPEELAVNNLRVTGGVVVRYVRVIDVRREATEDPDVPALAVVSLDRTGDASAYRLHVSGLDGIDQRYAEAPFSFFPDADDRLDCAGASGKIPAAVPPPPLDYLAKDYSGFRKVMLDRLAVTLPDWQESHIPDVGIVLVELLAYVADRLSYYQDAVATEAYLATARRRISVRRHARLIDYTMHEGCNARALVQIAPEKDNTTIAPSTLVFRLANQDDIEFHPLPVPGDQMHLRQAYTGMDVHCWGDTGCTLPKGAVSATLVVPDPESTLSLRAGDFLILEVVRYIEDTEVLYPDPQWRHPVRLTSVTKLQDPLLDKDLLRVTWSPEDALPAEFPLLQKDSLRVTWSPQDAVPPEFPLDSSGQARVVITTTVFRGNLLLVDHGRLVTDGYCAGGKPLLPVVGPSYRSITVKRRGSPAEIARLCSWPADDPTPAAAVTDWIFVRDLTGSGPDDTHVTRIDDDGTTVLRFGDGVYGRDPLGQAFEIIYSDGSRLGGRPIPPVIGAGRRRTITLSTSGLTYAEPAAHSASAWCVLTDRHPRDGDPQIELLRSWSKDHPNDITTQWSIRPDLTESGPEDPHATVEIDDDGIPILRFGDGICGRDPSDQLFEISYRVGNGMQGNVGADRITCMDTRHDRNGEQSTRHRRHRRRQVDAIGKVRNPLPACGGTDQEDVERAKLLAPNAFRDWPMRAITEDDYARLAKRLEPSLQRAVCSLIPSGGRQLARVAIDPRHTDVPDETLERRVAAALAPYRRIGHDVKVVQAVYVPLLLRLQVEVMDGYIQGHVRAALQAALGTGMLPDGSLGAFHPDKLTFGTSIYESRLIAAAQALDGVRDAKIMVLARLFDRERGNYANGVLPMAWYEIPQLDNDPVRPDRGRLDLHLVGGLA